MAEHMMKDKTREIIKDFASEVKSKARKYAIIQALKAHCINRDQRRVIWCDYFKQHPASSNSDLMRIVRLFEARSLLGAGKRSLRVFATCGNPASLTADRTLIHS